MTVPAKWLGIANPNSYYTPSGISDLVGFEQIAGAHVDVANCFFPLGMALNAAHVQAFNARGTTPMLTLSLPGTSGPDPTELAAVNAGTYDAVISSNAAALKNTGHMIRLLHEMNGSAFSYSQQPQAYLQAWQRVRGLWRQAGNNAPFVWCANVTAGVASEAFAPYFPGDSQCEIVALDGYSYPLIGSPSFQQIFAADLATLEALSANPVVIAETGIHQSSPNRGPWLDAAFAFVASDPRITGFGYWNRDVSALADQPTAYHVGEGMAVWRSA